MFLIKLLLFKYSYKHDWCHYTFKHVKRTVTKSPITVVFTSRVTYRTSANINKEVKGVIARTDPCSTLPQVGTVSSVDLSLSLSLCHLEGIEPLAGCSCVSAATYPGSYTMCAAGGGGGGGREFMQTSWTGRP